MKCRKSTKIIIELHVVHTSQCGSLRRIGDHEQKQLVQLLLISHLIKSCHLKWKHGSRIQIYSPIVLQPKTKNPWIINSLHFVGFFFGFSSSCWNMFTFRRFQSIKMLTFPIILKHKLRR